MNIRLVIVLLLLTAGCHSRKTVTDNRQFSREELEAVWASALQSSTEAWLEEFVTSNSSSELSLKIKPVDTAFKFNMGAVSLSGQADIVLTRTAETDFEKGVYQQLKDTLIKNEESALTRDQQTEEVKKKGQTAVAAHYGFG